MENKLKKIVIIPSDPISDYEEKGTSGWLKEYYNPNNYFDEVYVLSYKESVARNVYGLIIVPVSKSGSDFKRKVKEINPLFVRAYGGYWATDFAVFNKIKGIPVISSIHDTNPDLIFKSLQFCDSYISMSEVIKQILIKNKYAKESEILVLGNRINTENFKKIGKDNLKLKALKDQLPFAKFILSVGRRNKEKNITNTIKSLSHLPKEIGLIQIGKGSTDEYQKTIVENKLEERVHWINKVENDELPYYYNLAALLCVPSRWEGFGVVFIEAICCHTKIVTSNIAPMNEYIINDTIMNSLVDDFENPKSLASSILKLLTTNEENTNTVDKVKERYDIKVVAKNEINWCKKLSDQRKTKSLKYYKWKYDFYYKAYFFGKIKRFPKRIWRKMHSYL